MHVGTQHRTPEQRYAIYTVRLSFGAKTSRYGPYELGCTGQPRAFHPRPERFSLFSSLRVLYTNHSWLWPITSQKLKKGSDDDDGAAQSTFREREGIKKGATPHAAWHGTMLRPIIAFSLFLLCRFEGPVNDPRALGGVKPCQKRVSDEFGVVLHLHGYTIRRHHTRRHY